MAGKDAVTLQPGAQLVMTHPQLGKHAHPHPAQAFDSGSWHQIDENDPRLNLSEGKLEIRAGEKNNLPSPISVIITGNRRLQKRLSMPRATSCVRL